MPNSTLSQIGFLDEDAQQETVYDIEDSEARSDISTLENKIGSANGIAELDANGRVPSSQLPSYVDDVLEYASQSAFPATGETGKIYIALDTNKTYRWSGTAYVEISESLALGETSSTAYAGNKGKANADAIAAMKDGSSIDSFGDVEEALAGKVDKVAGKGLSTNDYDNTAKGIVDDIQDNVKANTQLILESIWGENGKNILENKATPSTISDVVFAVNQDKSVTVSGENTSGDWVNKTINTLSYDAVKGKVLSGVTGGSLQTYMIFARIQNSSGGYLSEVNCVDGDVIIPANVQNAVSVTFNIRVASGYTFTNSVSVYPMIRDASILDPTYEPYHSSVKDTLRDAEVIKGKNIFNNKTNTVGNITFAVDEDGYTTASNANDERSSLNYSNYNIFMPLKAGRYFIRVFQKTAKTSGYIGLHIADSSLNKYVAIGNDTDWNNAVNNGVYFTIPSDMEVGILYKVGNGSYAFMITDDSETDPSYEPYYIPLKDSMFPREEQRVLGATNLLPNTHAINSAVSNGLTITTYSDGTVKIDGTATAETWYNVNSNFSPKQGRYILNGCPKGGSVSAYRVMLVVRNAEDTGDEVGYRDYGDGLEVNIPADGRRCPVFIVVGNGQTVSNLVFKPMLSLDGGEYAPYAMTNKELTEKNTQTSETFGQVIASKYGDIVSLAFTGTTIVNEDGKTLGTLSADYKPKTNNINIYTKVYNGSSYVDAQVKVSASSGAVELLTLSGNAVEGAMLNFLLCRPIFLR